MVSKSFIAYAFLLCFTTSVNAHALIGPALGVTGNGTRNDVQTFSANKPCGNTDIAKSIDSSTAVRVAADGTFSPFVTDFNGGSDGSRSIKTVQVDASGTGQNFVAAKMVVNGDANPTSAGTEQLQVQLPSGTKCTGGTGKNLCLASFVTTAGFGNCVVVSQAQAQDGNPSKSANPDKNAGKQAQDGNSSKSTNSDKNTGNNSCNSTDNSTGNSTNTSTGNNTDKNSGKDSDKNSGKDSDKNTDKSGDKNTDKSGAKNTDKSGDKNTDKSTDSNTDKNPGKNSDKNTDKSTDKSTEQNTDKSKDKDADKSADKSADNSTCSKGNQQTVQSDTANNKTDTSTSSYKSNGRRAADAGAAKVIRRTASFKRNWSSRE